MNTLSEGITIINEEENLDYELLYFFSKIFDGNIIIPEADIFIWTKIGCLIGHIYPNYSELPTEEKEYLEKEFFKEMWNYNLLDRIDADKTSEIRDMQKATISAINTDKVKFEDNLSFIHHVYMDEINGVMNHYEKKIKNKFDEFIQISNIDKYENDEKILHIIYEKFYKKTMHKYLSQFDIAAKIYATIRWNKNQKFKTNDIDDIGHTFTALPYFNYFFTERSFCQLIKQIEYDKKYSCVLEHNKEKILQIIKKI